MFASRSQKRHTGCFTCSRFFFNRVMRRCPHCRSAAVQHYSTNELELLARTRDGLDHPAPAKAAFATHEA